MTVPAPNPADLREAMARALYAHDSAAVADAPAWDGDALDARHPGMRELYRARADALAAGPLAVLMAEAAEREEELHVLRRQRMAPERERELLEANNRMLERAQTADGARDAAEGALAAAERERDAAREAEAFWQKFAFDADELATERLVAAIDGRTTAERAAVRERAQRERVEGALHLFADRAEMMPKEGWVSDLVGMNRDIPLWWFHAARTALEPVGQPGAAANGAGEGAAASEGAGDGR